MQSVRVGGFQVGAYAKRNGQVVIDGKAPNDIGSEELSEVLGIACNRVNALPEEDCCEYGRFRLKTLRADNAGRVLREMKRVILERVQRSPAITVTLGLFGKRSHCARSMPKRVQSRAPHAEDMSRRLKHVPLLA